jgi:hypothetical protein
MDEGIRVWVSATRDASPAGKWIWNNKVVGSTFQRSPKLKAYIAKKHLKLVRLKTPEGEITAPEISIPQSYVIPFIRRLTKGFLYTFEPEYDYASDFFSATYVPPTPEGLKGATALVSLLPQVAIGNGVFRLWHGITTDTRDAGVCVYLFYEGVLFICFHGKRDVFKQEFPDKYEEAKGLPPCL